MPLNALWHDNDSIVPIDEDHELLSRQRGGGIGQRLQLTTMLACTRAGARKAGVGIRRQHSRLEPGLPRKSPKADKVARRWFSRNRHQPWFCGGASGTSALVQVVIS